MRTLRGVRVDGERVGDRVGAGGLQRALALDLDHADAAHAGDLEVRVVAERGDVDADGLGGVAGWCMPKGTLVSIAVDGDGHVRADGRRGCRGPARAATCWSRCAAGLVVSRLVAHAAVLALSAWAGRLMISSPKCSRMDRKALELVWPRPHLEATCMVPLRLAQLGEVLRGAGALLELLGRLEHLGVAEAARGALAARLVDEELEEVLGHVEHVALRAEDHDGAAGGDVLEGHLAGELGARHARARGAADLHCLGVLAADFLEQVGDLDARRGTRRRRVWRSRRRC